MDHPIQNGDLIKIVFASGREPIVGTAIQTIEHAEQWIVEDSDYQIHYVKQYETITLLKRNKP